MRGGCNWHLATSSVLDYALIALQPEKDPQFLHFTEPVTSNIRHEIQVEGNGTFSEGNLDIYHQPSLPSVLLLLPSALLSSMDDVKIKLLNPDTGTGVRK